MDAEEFKSRRAAEREWANANGFDNGDPGTNGELKLLAALRGQFDCFVDIGANNGLYIDALNACIRYWRSQEPAR